VLWQPDSFNQALFFRIKINIRQVSSGCRKFASSSRFSPVAQETEENRLTPRKFHQSRADLAAAAPTAVAFLNSYQTSAERIQRAIRRRRLPHMVEEWFVGRNDAPHLQSLFRDLNAAATPKSS